jgi:hypothetical protein
VYGHSRRPSREDVTTGERRDSLRPCLFIAWMQPKNVGQDRSLSLPMSVHVEEVRRRCRKYAHGHNLKYIVGVRSQ